MRIAAHHPALLLLLAIACNPAVQADEEEEEVPTLKSLAEYPVGVAIQARHLTESTRTALITSTFSSITAEYEMKPNPISTGPGSYNWQRADALVEFAEENDMQVHGHALVWHETVPNWMQNFGGSDAEFEAAVKEYVTTVVQRYRGRVVSWDVINEAFENGSGALRNSVFHRRMGDDYLARLFRYAREADPDVLLFYNDYGTPGDRNKRRAMLEMIDDFQERGIPIDGVGLQMHVTLTFPQLSDIIETIDEIVKRGLRVHISELDVRVNADGALSSLTRDRALQQKARVKAIVQAFHRVPKAQRSGITTWGLADPDSWLINFWDRPEWGLLFDSRFRPKPAYEGFVEALQEDQ